MDKLELSNPHKWTSLLLSPQVDKLQNLQYGQIKSMKSTQVDKLELSSPHKWTSLLLSSRVDEFIPLGYRNITKSTLGRVYYNLQVDELNPESTKYTNRRVHY